MQNQTSTRGKSKSKDWEKRFIMRHNVLLRKPVTTSINKITTFNPIFPQFIQSYFWPNKNYNFHETGIISLQRPLKIYPEKGQKCVGFVKRSEREKEIQWCVLSKLEELMYHPCLYLGAQRRGMFKNIFKHL